MRVGRAPVLIVTGALSFASVVPAHEKTYDLPTTVQPAVGGFDPAAHPPLRLLARDAVQVVEGRVEGIEDYDDGRIRIFIVRVDSRLKGAATDPVRVVDQRAAVRTRSLIRRDRPAILLLRPAGDYSYLRKHLPGGDYGEVRQDYGGVWQAERAENHAGVVRYVRAALQAGDDAVAIRNLAFLALASPEQRLQQDGLRELVRLPSPHSLSEDETSIVRGRLAIGGPVAEALADWLGGAKRTDALPLIIEASAALPRLAGNASLLSRLYAARAAQGAPAAPAEFETDLAHPLPGIRAAAVAALSFHRTNAAVARLVGLGRTDPSSEVRIAAAVALGRIGGREAVDALARMFDTDDGTVRRACGGVLRELGAADSLERLARHASSSAARRDAATFLVMAVGQEDRRVQALMRDGPLDVRETLAKSIKRPRALHSH